MEKQRIIDWLIGDDYDYGSGEGSGYCSSDGSGDGSGDGSYSNYSYGAGSGYGSGSGSGSSDGSGEGSGYGYGYGSVSGYGYGYGSFSGYGLVYGYGGENIKSANGKWIFYIDGTPTIIKNIVGNLAKGFIFMQDFTMNPCYVVRDGHGLFAHGETAEGARRALEAKILESIDEDEAIEKIIEKFGSGERHAAEEFYNWHHYLTGSCELGRKSFMENHGIQMDDLFTIDEFIDLTKNDYGSEQIEKLRLALDAWRKRGK